MSLRYHGYCTQADWIISMTRNMMHHDCMLMYINDTGSSFDLCIWTLKEWLIQVSVTENKRIKFLLLSSPNACSLCFTSLSVVAEEANHFVPILHFSAAAHCCQKNHFSSFSHKKTIWEAPFLDLRNENEVLAQKCEAVSRLLLHGLPV